MKRRNLTLFFIALLLSANLNLPAAAALRATQDQPVDEKLTREEKREAISLARMFVERLRETRDITPLISEFFASDFSPQNSTLLFEEVAPDVIANLSREELLRCYAAEFNLSYLTFLHFMAIDTPDSSEHIGPEEIFPPELTDLIARNANMESVLGETEDGAASQSEAEFRIQSLEQLRNAMAVMEEAVRLMQDHFTKNPPEQSPFFKENFKQAAKGFDAFKPALQIDEELLNTLPAGARVIEINIPFFQLTLIRSDSGLKIFGATFCIHC